MISLRYRHNFLCESIHVHVQTLVYSFVHLHRDTYIHYQWATARIKGTNT